MINLSDYRKHCGTEAPDPDSWGFRTPIQAQQEIRIHRGEEPREAQSRVEELAGAETRAQKPALKRKRGDDGEGKKRQRRQ